jgi:hypothetical protein
MSHRIVDFARKHSATILTFEHLGNFRPQKGKYSKRSNEKRTYWLRGKSSSTAAIKPGKTVSGIPRQLRLFNE